MKQRKAPILPPVRPMVVAHRGASHLKAEHTLGAYVAAIESGADALECDVRLTKDGHLVCVHDRRVDRTSTGRGIVSEFDLAGLNALDFSSWHNSVAAARQNGSPDVQKPAPDGDSYLAGVAPDRVNGGVLTLEMLLGLVRDAERPVKVLIETKHPTRYAGMVERELVRVLARFGWAGPAGAGSTLVHDDPQLAGRAIVMSFAATAIRRVRLLAPRVPTVLLMDWFKPGRRDGELPNGVGIAGPGLHLVRADPGYVARAHAQGNQVFVWTVDEPADVGDILALGVDAIITNRPADVVAKLSAIS